jgi:hypothetical protein
MAQPQSTLAFTTESLPAFTKGKRYHFQLTASGGKPPYSYALSQGALPAGITMNASGLISGIPANSTDTTAFIKLSDAAGAAVTQAFDCQVN